MNKNTLRLALTSIFCGLFCPCGEGAITTTDKKWVGIAGGGDGVLWSDSKNWNPQTLPTVSDRVVFACGGVVSNDLENCAVGSIQHNGDLLKIVGKPLVVGTKNNDDKIVNTGKLEFHVKVLSDFLNFADMDANSKISFLGGWERHSNQSPVPRLEARYGYVSIGGGEGCKCSLTGDVYTQGYSADYVEFTTGGHSLGSYNLYGNNYLYLRAKDAFSGAVNIGHTATDSRQGTCDLCGNDQTMWTRLRTSCPTDVSKNYRPTITSSQGKANIVLTKQTSSDCVAVFRGEAGLCWAPETAATFKFRHWTHDTTGELVVSNGTVQLADGATFTQLSKLVVANGATLAVDNGSGVSFFAEKMEIGENATLNLGQGVVLTTISAKIIHQDGTFHYLAGGETHPHGEGVLRVNLPDDPTSTATWDAGGAADDRISFAANWENDIRPDLESGGMLATFAEGSSVTVDQTVRLNGIMVTQTAGDFAFKSSDGHGIRLFAGGLVLAAGSAARKFSFLAPVEVSQKQTWKVNGLNDVLSMKGGLSGAPDAELTVSGGAMLAIEDCTTTFTGNLVSPTTGRVVLKNADVGGNLTLSNGSVALYDYASNESAASADNRSSVIRGELYFKGANQVYCRGRLVLEGGVRQDSAVYLKGGVGTVVITNKPNAATVVRTWFVDNSTTTELWAPGNLLNLMLYNNAKVRCKVAGALSGAGSMELGISAFDIDRRGWLYMDGDQGVSTLTSYVARHGSGAQEIFSDGHAVLTTADPSDKTHYVIFKGGASYRQAGTGSVVLCKASTSTGTVDVVAGSLTFGNATNGTYWCAVGQKDYAIASEGGSWTNAARVTVGGGDSAALVRILHVKTFGRETAVEISPNGGVYLADGVVEKVHSLSIDGQPMGGGTWGSPTSSAYYKSSRFSGNGILRVKGGGMMIMVW